MQIVLYHEDISTLFRSETMLDGLIKQGHCVITSSILSNVPDTDLFIYGMSQSNTSLIDLPNITSKIAILQVDDKPSMDFHRLSPELYNRAHVFLRNHWPHDFSNARIGYMPTFINPIEGISGKELKDRSIKVMFYGIQSHISRVKLLEILKNSQLPFDGGTKIRFNIYHQKAKDTSILLAPWGYHPLTYRLYEGFAYRSLVIGQRIDMSKCINGELEAGKHFVVVNDDLSDLIDKINYYLNNLDEAQEIANTGYEHYIKYLAPKNDCLISDYVFDKCFKSWNLETLSST
jgi:hypothetical protein